MTGAGARGVPGYGAEGPVGVGLAAAWAEPGGDGAGVTVADVELGWDLTHEDLAGAMATCVGGESDPAWADHGTRVLGVVTRVVPAARVVVASQHRGGGRIATAEAIGDALGALGAGDVLLLEAQVALGGRAGLLAEARAEVFAAVREATGRGVLVVEAAGNGGVVLEGMADSGAVVVGAAVPGVPHWRCRGASHGARVDCYAWGAGVETASGGLGARRTTEFGGSSSAAAIVAGVAAAVQGMARARTGRALAPGVLRAWLRDPQWNTPSAVPDDDRVGVMPDLRKIIGFGLTRL